MNLEQRYSSWATSKKIARLRSIMKRGFCPIYVLTVRYPTPVALKEAREQFELLSFGLDFLNRVADRSEVLAPRNPVIIGTVDNDKTVSVMKIWIDMAIPRFDAPHLINLPAEVFAQFIDADVSFRKANGCAKKFSVAIAKAEKMDCFFQYPSAKAKPKLQKSGLK